MTEESAAETAEETPEESAPEAAAEETSGTTEETVDETPAQPEETPAQETENTSDDASEEESAPKEDAAVSETETEGDGQETTGTVTETENEAEVSADADAEATADGAGEEVRKVEIKITDSFKSNAEDSVVVDWDENSQSGNVTTVYDEKIENPFKGIVENFKDYENYNWIDLEGIDGNEGEYNEDTLKKQLKYTWKQKGDDGNYSPMAGASAPVNAGEYRLEISIDQELVAAEPKEIDFVIEKAKLYIKVAPDKLDTSKLSSLFAGKTVSEVQEAYAEALQIALGEEEDSAAADERYLQFVTATDKSVVKVSDPLGEVLADTVVLKKGSDYLVEISPALKEDYQKNYELNRYAETIVITDLIDVSLETELNLEPGKDITYVYGDTANPVKSPLDTTAAADKQVTVKIIVTGEKDEATGEDKELPVVLDGDKKNIAGVWLDANEEELDEGAVPTDAGVYYYKLIYTDPDGVYGVDTNVDGYKDCLVKVVVEPAKLVVRPTLADDKKVYQKGTAVSDLLKNVGYGLYGKDAAGAYTVPFTIPSEEKDTFWGVSYNQPNKPQYYEPVFKVQKRTTTTTTYTDPTKKAETVEGSWTDVTTLDEASGEVQIDAQSDKDKTVKKDVAYRIVFAGQKGLYKNGIVDKEDSIVDINEQIDVNSANKNYDVDAAKNVVEDAANVVTITVNKSTEVKIDPADIISNIQNMPAVDGIYTKEYDEKAPFADRSGYKKAKTDNADANSVGSFTYEWYGYDMVPKLDDKGEEVKDDAGNPVEVPECDNIKVGTDNDYTLNTLANAGQYCLKISYKDPTNTYTAKPAYLFFEIKGKLVKVVPDANYKPKAYTNQSVGAFLAELEKTITYSIYEKDENGTNITETLKQLDEEVNAADKDDHLYSVEWVVLQGDNTDPAKAKYTRVFSGEFKENVPYKLGAVLTFEENDNQKYNKYYLNYTNAYEREETDQIQHNYWYNPLDIELGVMSNVGLKIDFHPEKLAALEAEYNGEEQFKVEDLITAGYITVAADNNPDTALAIGEGEGQVPLVFEWQNYIYDEAEDEEYPKDLDEGIANPVNAGKYKLTVSYPGDDKYREFSEEAPEDFWINPKDLKIQVTAALAEDAITAGWDMSDDKVRDSLVNKDSLTVTGYIAADKEAFAGNDTGTGLVKDAPAFEDSYNVRVWEKGKKDDENTWGSAYKKYLRFGEEYEVGIDAWLHDHEEILKDKLASNYNIVVEDAAFKVGKRGNSTVEDAEDNYHSDDTQDGSDWVAMHVRASAEGTKVTVTPVSGICYFYDKDTLGLNDPDTEFVPGNYLIFDIVAPKEFDANGRWDMSDPENWEENEGDYNDAFKNFVYKNSIEGTGKGYVLSEDKYNGTIRVAFPVTKEDQSEARNFTILWEKLNGQNYTEDYTVDMSNAQLEDDLRTAVEPKKLAFNGVKTKMTVGETQQLDVKITKVLNSDVVFLNYKVADGGEKFASVTTETGVVTALSKGKATIEVYPVKRNDKGEVEPIPVKKPVRTTITINDVTAPKINSIYAYDDNFELKYTQPADGYRREVYVLEGKNIKKDVFEQAITKAQNDGKNKLDEAFVAWDYITNEIPDSKTKVVTIDTRSIEGLKSKIEPGKEYTVYVRNVSGVRTLDDGSLVVASAAGNVKSFKSTKIQLEGIRLDYKTEEEQAKKTPEEEKIYSDSIDEIDLSKGSVQLKAMGAFKMQPATSDAEDSSYGTDYELKELPLAKNDANYETQKLTFYAVESTVSRSKEDIAKYKNLKKEYKTLIGDRYYKPSSIAKIDKKGKLTLKGIGIVYIIAYDSVSKEITPIEGSGYTTNIDRSLEVSKNSGHYALRITSPITAIKAKAVTLKVGSHVYVRPNLTFFNGKKKLAVNADDRNIDFIVKNTNDSKAVAVDKNNDNYDEYYLIAKEPNETVSLSVCLADDPAVETTMTVKTKTMDPVKSVKAVDVIDDSATLTFTHTANENSADALESEHVRFKIDLRDNRNRLISSHMVEPEIDWEKFDEKKGVYFYRHDIGGLKRQSKYNVLVTPFYGGQTAKEAKGKLTTTNIPAAGNTFVGKDEDGNLLEGGMAIRIASAGVRYDSTWNDEDAWDIEEVGYLTSGNSYTLIAEADSAAMERKTDILTWKSTNSKVASVKANVGSYTATLKASSVGYTYIEVTSKITKKVIARYIVRVKSVGNGGQGAYGDTEPRYNVAWDPYYDQGIEVLTEKNPVRFATPMGQYDYRWISFTAPADGRYNLYGNAKISGYYYKTDFPEEYDGGKKEEFSEYSYAELKEGDTIYFKAAGNTKNATAVVNVRAEKYGKLTASGSVNVAGLGQVTFTAAEDNYYTFYASESGKFASYEIYDPDKNEITKRGNVDFATEGNAEDVNGVGVKKGQRVRLYNIPDGDYTISVKGRTYGTFDNEGKATTGTLADDGKEGSVTGKWFTYEAKAAGEYTFTVSPDKVGAMAAKYFTGVIYSENDNAEAFGSNNPAADEKETLTISRPLNEDEKIAIYVFAKEGVEAVSADISVSRPKTAEVSLEKATDSLTVEKDKPVWVSFKVPEKGKEYCFSYTLETGKTVNPTYYQNDVNTRKYNVYQDRFTSTADDKIIYIRLQTNDDSANVTVSVKETAATAVTLGQDAPFEVKDNNMQFFTFTAPTTGLYRVETTLAEESKDKIVNVKEADRVSQDASTESVGIRKLFAGEKLILAVQTYSSDVVKGNIKVSAITFETLEAKEYTLAANETKWFRFTPNATGKYLIKYDVTTGAPSLTWGSKMDYINSSWPADNLFDVPAGDVVYVKAVNDDSAESKVTFTIVSADQPLPADGKLTVKANSPVSYKYVVKQTGRYKVTYTADVEDADPSVTYVKTRSSLTSGEEIVCPTKGETITFTVSVAKDAVVTLTVEPIVPSTTLEATVAKEGGVQWFEYTAPATGRYTVEMTDDAGKAVAADVLAECTYERITNTLVTFDGPRCTWINKGDKWYFKVTNKAAADQKVKIAFTPVTASEELKVGEDPKTVTMNAGEAKWYKLTLDEDTFYNWTIENAFVELYADRYGKDDDFEDCDNCDNIDSSTMREFAKGTYLVRVKRPEGTADADATKIGVKKEATLTLKEGEDLSISSENGKEQYIKFTPSKDAYYAFRLKEVPDDVSSVYVHVNAYGYNFDLTKSKTYIYSSSKMTMANPVNITATLNFTPATEGEKKTVKLSVEEIKSAELVSDLSVTVEKGAKSWLTFTAPKAGYYNFAEDGKDVLVKYNTRKYYGDEMWLPDDYGYDGVLPKEHYYLEENAKLVFSVFYDEKKPDSTAEKLPDSVTFKMTATEFKPEKLSLSTPQTITFAENETEKWYSFEPDFKDYYVFTFSGKEGNVNVTYFNGDTSNEYAINLEKQKEIENLMYSNSAYLFKFTTDNPLSFNLEVHSKTLDSMDESSAEEIDVEETKLIGIDDGYKLFKFTAPDTGIYTFYTEGRNDSYGTLFDSNLKCLAEDDDDGHNNNFKITHSLMEDQIVYLKVNEYSNESLQNCSLHVIKGTINPPDDEE